MTLVFRSKLLHFFQNFEVKKPWDTIIISLLNLSLTTIIFIIIHQNTVNFNWIFKLDRIIIFVLLLVGFQLLFNYVRKIILLITLFIALFLLFGSVFNKYGFSNIIEDYRSLVYTMSDNASPQDIILSRLLPFPNKSKIIKATNFRNPNVRNFALLATSENFRNIKGFRKYRTTIQCFAVFKEIKQRWNYVNDPKESEYIASASESLIHFSGDCDDHAILMAACIRAIGGTPRIISTADHYYPEMLIGSLANFENINYLIKNVLFVNEAKNKQIHYHLDENNQVWLNLDYTAQYPGGPFMSEEILGALTLY